MSGECEKCGRWENLELHHVIYRSQSKYLIKEKLNHMMLCMECHADAHRSKVRFNQWLDENKPGLREQLMAIHDSKRKRVA